MARPLSKSSEAAVEVESGVIHGLAEKAAVRLALRAHAFCERRQLAPEGIAALDHAVAMHEGP